ncbi:MAG TPA: putative Ig domain-containing protein [Chloroflexia bacterium]|nr:putative Ig domain-containing protein [Chloroflexia bacterium]
MFKRFGAVLMLLLLGALLVGQAQASSGSSGGSTKSSTPTPGPTSVPLTITTDALAEGTAGASYASFLDSWGGVGVPHRWALIAGRLPDGLKLESYYGMYSTVIAGTPRQAQTTSFTVRVQDSAGHTATKTFSITIH